MTAVDDARLSPTTETTQTRAERGAGASSRVASAPRVQPSLENRKLWERRYARRLRWTDTLVVVIAVMATSLGQILAFTPDLLTTDPWVLARVPLLTAITWLLVLGLFRTRTPSIMGSGATEYKRVAHASASAFGLLAIVFVVVQAQGLRWQLIVAFPIGLLSLLAARWVWRKWLLRQRRFGHYLSRALVVGERDDVEYVIGRLQRQGHQHGYIVVGTTVGDASEGQVVVDGSSYCVIGTLETAAAVARELSADSIIVASQPAGDPDFVKRLSWQIEGTAAELILSSRLTDVAGPRISFRPVEDLPLIAVKIPSFEGGRHVVKRGFDIVLSSAALLAISVLLPFIALAIKVDSPGPVFFRQSRVGRDGREFRMVKFRSMKTTAEQELASLLAENEGAGPLFKMKTDPRVTRVGRILRKFSLDELPQFWNVLVGDMSIVGPRPPLPSEVTAYDGTVFRRLYINPGITGLWQISGRSDLSWEESVKLDLRYVENWSLTNDLMIMWRTVKVMVSPKGAY